MAMLFGGTPGQLVDAARKEEDPSAFPGIIAWARRRPAIAGRVFFPEFPETPAQLKSLTSEERRLFNFASPDREVAWACARLVPHADQLGAFTGRAAQFGQGWLRNDFRRCESILGDVQREFGWSLWLVRQQLMLRQATGGLDAQKRHLKSLADSGLAGMAGLVGLFSSQLNDPSVTPARLIAQYHQWEGGFSLPRELAAYLRYLALRDLAADPDSIGAVLNYEGAGAIIDLYDTLLVVGQHLASGAAPELIPIFRRSVDPLVRSVADPRLRMVLFALGEEVDLTEAHPASVAALEYLLAGSARDAHRSAMEALRDDPAQPDALEIAARAVALEPEMLAAGQGSMLFQLISRMGAIVARHPSANEDAQELTKVALNCCGQPWADALLGFVERETSSDPLGRGRASCRAAAGNPFLHPLRVPALCSASVRRRYAALVGERYVQHSRGTAYARSCATGMLPMRLDGFAQEPALLLTAHCAFQTEDFTDALAAADRLRESPLKCYSYPGLRLTAHCLLRLGRAERLLPLLVSHYLADRRVHEILPLKDMGRAMGADLRRRFAADLAVPIFFDMYATHVEPDRDSERVYATEDFLLAHGVDRPSELAGLVDQFDRARLVYFLRHVCVETVIDTHLAYSGSQDVRNERVNVCRLLVQLDSSEAETYQAEIKDLLRKLMIQRRMREVEQSKIHVDIDGIRRTADSALRESFNRLVAQLRAGLRIDQLLELEEVIRNALGDAQLRVVQLPKAEHRDLLWSMVQQLRDLYVSSAEHGLDKYLSVRIRHQTLAGHLRKPLEEVSLITQLDKESGNYKPNDHWLARVGSSDADVNSVLSERFSTFAREFDALVSTIRDEWIQIRTESVDRGLFNFAIDGSLVLQLAQKIDGDTTFEEFVETTLETLGAMLDENLGRIRARLEDEAKARVNRLFTDLQGGVDLLSARANTTELTKAIRDAHTAMQFAIGRVIEWFHRARAAGNEPFDVEDAIHISEEIVRIGPSGFTARPFSVEGEPFQLPGWRFNDYVDILSTVFGNVVRHSDQGAPTAEITIRFSKESVYFRVENEVGDGVATADVRERVDRIKTDLADGQFRRAVAREGGTGFYKIGKILDDFGSRRTLQFGFVGENRFFVEFQTPLPDGAR